MSALRAMTAGDAPLVTRIAAEGFQDDPVMSWVVPDPDERRRTLPVLFGGMVSSYEEGRDHVYLLDEVSVALWRPPSFVHDRTTGERVRERQAAVEEEPLPAEVMERLALLGDLMRLAHPHTPHWYLNVVSTLPEQRGRGLGARVLAPVLERSDADGIPAYLESSNARNMTLYRRLGFVDSGEINVPGGPTLYPMWRRSRRDDAASGGTG